MDEKELDLITESLSKIRKIRANKIVEEINRIKEKKSNEASLKLLKQLERDLEEIIEKERTAIFKDKYKNKT